MIFVIKKIKPPQQPNSKFLLDKHTWTLLLVYPSLPREGSLDRWKKDHGSYGNSLSCPLG